MGNVDRELIICKPANSKLQTTTTQAFTMRYQRHHSAEPKQYHHQERKVNTRSSHGDYREENQQCKPYFREQYAKKETRPSQVCWVQSFSIGFVVLIFPLHLVIPFRSFGPRYKSCINVVNRLLSYDAFFCCAVLLNCFPIACLA